MPQAEEIKYWQELLLLELVLFMLIGVHGRITVPLQWIQIRLAISGRVLQNQILLFLMVKYGKHVINDLHMYVVQVLYSNMVEILLFQQLELSLWYNDHSLLQRPMQKQDLSKMVLIVITGLLQLSIITGLELEDVGLALYDIMYQHVQNIKRLEQIYEL